MHIVIGVLVFIVGTSSRTTWAAEQPAFAMPRPLNTTADRDLPSAADLGQDDARPRVATDGQGTWITVWDTKSPAAGTEPFPQFGKDRDIVSARSTDGGATWTDPVPVNDATTDDNPQRELRDERPCVATDGQGLWVTVWTSNGNPNQDADIEVASSTNAGASWENASALVPSFAGDDHSVNEARAGENFPEVIAVESAEELPTGFAVVWQTDSTVFTNRVLFARSTGFGATGAPTWPACPTVLNPALEAPPDPGAVNSPCGETYRTIYADEPFPPGVKEQVRFPHLAAAGSTLVVVWSGGSATPPTVPSRDIFFVRSEDGGLSWSTPKVLLPAMLVDDAIGDVVPRVTTDGNGLWVVIWRVEASGEFYLQVSRSTDDGQTWETPTTIDTVANENGPQIVPDGSNGLLAVWTDKAAGTAPPGADFDLRYARSPDAVTWTPPELLNRNAFSDDGNDAAASIAVDAAGTRVVVWQSDSTLVDVFGPDRGLGDDADILVASDPGCGNEVIDPGEGCDDGNLRDMDCCSAACQIAAPGSPCSGTGGECGVSACEGETCVTLPAESGTECGAGALCSAPGTCDGKTFTCNFGNYVDGTPCRTYCDQSACFGGQCLVDESAPAPCGGGRCNADKPVGLECELCGNGGLDPGEECDDGGQSLNDGCTTRCELPCDTDGDCPPLRSCLQQCGPIDANRPLLGNRCELKQDQICRPCETDGECGDNDSCTMDICTPAAGCAQEQLEGFDAYTCAFEDLEVGACTDSINRLKHIRKMAARAGQLANSARARCAKVRAARALLRKSQKMLENALLEVLIRSFRSQIRQECADSLDDQLTRRSRRIRERLQFETVEAACATVVVP